MSDDVKALVAEIEGLADSLDEHVTRDQMYSALIALRSQVVALEAAQQAPAVDREALARVLLNSVPLTPSNRNVVFHQVEEIVASGVLLDVAEERRIEANTIANLIAKEATPGMEMNYDGTENREAAAYVEGIRVAHSVAMARAQQVREGEKND